MNGHLPSLRDVRASALKGKRVLLRLDVNVPLVHGEVGSDFRLVRSLVTIDYLRKVGAITIIIGHMGEKRTETLKPVFNYLQRKMDITFLPKLTDLKKTAEAPEGTVFLLENLRRSIGEEKNDKAFAETLAKYGDFYVNDAFASSHRPHASIVALPKLLPHAAGFGLLEEVNQLAVAFTPRKPFVFILGGAKFSTKLPVLKRFLKVADVIFVYGALAHSFFKAEGLEIGKSLVDKDVSLVKPLLSQSKILTPTDVIARIGAKSTVKDARMVEKNEIIVDAGPASILDIKQAVMAAKFVLWNGPLGNFEQGFGEGTAEVAQAIAKSNAYSIIGGGDTVAAIETLDLLKKFDFVSTGGGAMLDYLADGTLPGIEALKLKQPK